MALIVRPIDKSAKGSHKEIKTLMRAFAQVQQLNGEPGKAMEAMAAYDALEGVLLPHLATDEDRPVIEVFEEVSEEQYGELLGALLGGESVPEAKSTN